MGKRRIAQDYRNLALECGLVWLGVEPPGVMVKTPWRCAKGHEWLCRYNDIQQGHFKCPHCTGLFPKSSQDFHSLALRLGFVWTGTKADGVMAKTSWRCGSGHEWLATFHDIQEGNGCPRCAGLSPKVAEDYLALASSRGFFWLGPAAENVMAKTKWKCSEGHRWSVCYSSIQQGSGCPRCGGSFPKTSDDYRALADSRGFVCVKPEVSNTKTRTVWRCSRGHEWLATYNNLQLGTGCPKCANHISKPEIRLREVVTGVYPDTLGNQRKLLKSRGLELDIYIPSLRKAVEYDGWAHAYYLDAPARDQRKDAQCAEAGIELLRVTDEEYLQDPDAVTAKVLEWLAQPQSTSQGSLAL